MSRMSRWIMLSAVALSTIYLFKGISNAKGDDPNWTLGPFERADKVNPVLSARGDSCFLCPLQKKEVHWEGDHIFNPGAVVRDGKVYIFYRAEDDYGSGIGMHTSRLGMAVSRDGLHFQSHPTPVLFPDSDAEYENEWPGGCEDPRIVEREDGTYVMTYTQWNRKIPVLGVATSLDLVHWDKHGYAFAQANNGEFGRRYSKAGSIVSKQVGDRLVAAKINGKYWMYWGVGTIQIAQSDDLISWEPLLDQEGHTVNLIEPRAGKFDSALVEAGPPAVLTNKGIILLYNGKNAAENGDPNIKAGAYTAGQVLIDAKDPTKTIDRSEECFFKPEEAFETSGQYPDGIVFIQGLVHFKDKWLLYYGAADSAIGVAYSKG